MRTHPLIAVHGVYGGHVHVSGKRYKAAISVGAASTFSVEKSTIEPHLLDFEGDLYDKTITISFLAYLRPMQTFKSVEALAAVIAENIAWVRANIPA